MADMNCSACEDIRQTSPEFVVNGLTDDICTSLQNDTGLNPNDDHNDCIDLHNLNDCLVGNEATEVEAYDVCDWKTFMKQFIPNLWTTLKAIICAICGIWTNIHKLWEKVNCVYTGVSNLISALNQTTQGTSFVRYFRDNSGQSGQQYYWNLVEETSHSLDIYMDANVDSPGTLNADRDYIVMISNCTDFQNISEASIDLTFYSSADTSPISEIRLRRAQHPTYVGSAVESLSWTTSGAVLIKKGAHVKVDAHVWLGNSGTFRLHQFVLTWIPINAGSDPLDPSEIIPC